MGVDGLIPTIYYLAFKRPGSRERGKSGGDAILLMTAFFMMLRFHVPYSWIRATRYGGV
jgi:hypothetical protein